MDKIGRYRELVQQYICDHARTPSHGQIETLVAIDEARDVYALFNVGWTPFRVFGTIALARLHNEQIWIEHDGTPPPGMVDALIAAGVPQEDIILAFLPTEERSQTAQPEAR